MLHSWLAFWKHEQCGLLQHGVRVFFLAAFQLGMLYALRRILLEAAARSAWPHRLRSKCAPVRRVVLTGGPGAGKTTLLNELAARGYPVMEDSARGIIAERRSKGFSPRPEPADFAREVLRLDAENYSKCASRMGLVFFDRGVIDALCMLHHAEVLDFPELAELLSKYRYERRVFILPPWEAIYCTDNERDQTFLEARRAHEKVLSWYGLCHYEPIEVPRMSISRRSDFVLSTLEKG
jgi:predicted ATPase